MRFKNAPLIAGSIVFVRIASIIRPPLSGSLHRLPISEFPLLRSLASALAGYDGAAELERGLDILLTGLTTTVTPSGQSPPPAPALPPAR